jgi:hypothetical protein
VGQDPAALALDVIDGTGATKANASNSGKRVFLMEMDALVNVRLSFVF